MGWRVDSDLQQMLRESAEGYLADKGGPAHFRAVRESQSGFDSAAWKAMAELGWTGILLPESAGGSELGLEPALTLAEELGRAIAPEPFVSSAIIAATLLAEADGETATAMASAIVSGEATATLAWQEHTGQVSADSCETRLEGSKLTGRKVHVPAWHDATALLVSAISDAGPAVAIVDPGADGVTVEARRMTDGTHCANITFEGVPIDSDAVILSGSGAEQALALALARGTVALSAQLEGLASVLWQHTADYIKQRVQFEQPLSDFQVLRHRMVDLYTEIELSGASWRAAAATVEQGNLDSVALHAAKARCSQTALDMGRWAIQYHGAFGYTDEADVGLYVHTALRWASWLGNPEARRRRALASHRKEKAHG